MSKLPVNVKTGFKSDTKKDNAVEKTQEQISVSPPVDIYEAGDRLMMLMELPGVSKDKIQIKVDNGIISVSGESNIPIGGDLRYVEFKPCKYNRVFELSAEIDQEKITADYKQGILYLNMPKHEKAKPREITINLK